MDGHKRGKKKDKRGEIKETRLKVKGKREER
jgi:hypothetical protein